MKDAEDVDNSERDEIEKVQEQLAKAKDALQAAKRGMRKIGKINRDAGRAKAGNACLRFHGALREIQGKLDQAHADASDALLENWPEEGGVVVLGGGGGR